MAINGKTKLSPHFAVYEFVRTGKGQKYVDFNIKHIENNLQTMMDLCDKILEPIRAHIIENYADEYGMKGLRINSGIRSPELNALFPNASKTSQHIFCEAVDIYFPNTKLLVKVYKDIKEGKVKGLQNTNISQLILEKMTGCWMHIGIFTERWRQFRASKGKSMTTDYLMTPNGKSPYYAITEEKLKLLETL